MYMGRIIYLPIMRIRKTKRPIIRRQRICASIRLILLLPFRIEIIGHDQEGNVSVFPIRVNQNTM